VRHLDQAFCMMNSSENLSSSTGTIFLAGINLSAREKVRRKRIDVDGRLFYSVKDELYKYYDEYDSR